MYGGFGVSGGSVVCVCVRDPVRPLRFRGLGSTRHEGRESRMQQTEAIHLWFNWSIIIHQYINFSINGVWFEDTALATGGGERGREDTERGREGGGA